MDTTSERVKEVCEYCGLHVYYPCVTPNEAFSICALGHFAEPEVVKVGESPSSLRYDPALNAIPSAYSDEAYTEAVFKPHHYAKYKVEPITFIMENDLPYAVGNVIKYVMRYKDKNGLEDLKKARRYIDMIIEKEYGKESV